MGSPAIVAEGLSKRYRIGSLQPSYRALRDSIAARLRRSSKGSPHRDGRPPPTETIWALREVSFQVRRGEIVGVIGRNGAGKTTLLRILSRITDPTEGRATITGRVGSLLEVGTGFHPELTGLENIYLNGAVLGMKKAEIDRKLDEIVEFAEVGQFIDTPVKRYSSGMSMRLAFAVAAHLEPEILLIDEVLAVGDISFQKKCLGKMDDVAREGRTVIFVSHNLAAVDSLCQRGIVLEGGRVVKDDSASEAIRHYTRLMQGDYVEEANGGSSVAVQNLRVFGYTDGVIQPSHEATIGFSLHIHEAVRTSMVYLIVRDSDQRLIFVDIVTSRDLPALTGQGAFDVEVRFPPLWLSSGQYSCYIMVKGEALGTGERYVSEPIILSVVEPAAQGYQDQGVLSPRTVWSIHPAGATYDVDAISKAKSS